MKRKWSADAEAWKEKVYTLDEKARDRFEMALWRSLVDDDPNSPLSNRLKEILKSGAEMEVKRSNVRNALSEFGDI
jgi:hypothetical protein